MMGTGPSSSAPARLRFTRAWYSLGVLFLLVVGLLSLVPVSGTGVSDKLSHLLTYFCLAGWFSLLAANRRSLIWVFAGLFAYGILIELLQGMTSYRTAEWGDLLANGIGAGAGVLLYFTPLKGLLAYIDNRLA
jgi:VanZ family protein